MTLGEKQSSIAFICSIIVLIFNIIEHHQHTYNFTVEVTFMSMSFTKHRNGSLGYMDVIVEELLYAYHLLLLSGFHCKDNA